MKKLISIIGVALLSFSAMAQISSETNEVTVNYNYLGEQYAEGLFLGAVGYGAGMWISGNKTGWGLVGSVLAANIPILIEGKFSEGSTVLGRNAGALTAGLSFTFAIEMHRKNKLNYQLRPIFQR